jgi:hypothetical protein
MLQDNFIVSAHARSLHFLGQMNRFWFYNADYSQKIAFEGKILQEINSLHSIPLQAAEGDARI